jgi:hypothetical protein
LLADDGSIGVVEAANLKPVVTSGGTRHGAGGQTPRPTSGQTMPMSPFASLAAHVYLSESNRASLESAATLVTNPTQQLPTMTPTSLP